MNVIYAQTSSQTLNLCYKSKLLLLVVNLK